MMNKELINSRFAKTLSSYDENAKIQKRMAQRLIEFLPSKQFDSVLEIGCGTGFLTKFTRRGVEFERDSEIPKKKNKKKAKRIAKMKKKSRKINQKRKK